MLETDLGSQMHSIVNNMYDSKTNHKLFDIMVLFKCTPHFLYKIQRVKATHLVLEADLGANIM